MVSEGNHSPGVRFPIRTRYQLRGAIVKFQRRLSTVPQTQKALESRQVRKAHQVVPKTTWERKQAQGWEGGRKSWGCTVWLETGRGYRVGDLGSPQTGDRATDGPMSRFPCFPLSHPLKPLLSRQTFPDTVFILSKKEF